MPNHPRPAATPLAATLAIAVALGLAGCATPNLHSSVDVPVRFAAPAEAQDAPEVAWWESYGDPVLSDLVRRAARENRDIRMAVQRVRAARAGETISRSVLFPSIGLSASGQDAKTGHDAAVKQHMPDIQRGSAGLDVSWEIDLSGRLRAGAAAAAADALAAEHGASGVRLLVVSDVATNYFTLVGALRQLETVRAISAAQDETLRLVTARQRAGLATPFDVERAATEASRARAAIPPLETVVAVSRHRIAVLVGDQAVNAAGIATHGGELTVPPARPGQPATLLERRPDLLALKSQLDAANARRQQAQAEWFPRLFLGAVFGRESLELNNIDVGAAHFRNVAGLLAMPLFNAGRTRSINEIAESAQSEAVMRYEDGIVRALEDVENALVALGDERRRAVDLRNAANSADSALGRAQSLYDRGQIDLLPLLDAQRTRLAVRLGANDSDTQLLLDSVRLYKALGGGWQAFEPQPAATGTPPSTHS
ncbi:efflux transporter outer membrane subunit [Ramlibacter monticola]|uniref:TolC family protein n=1 Tax=Ramlibacter monticola TaxID=1926872 RepID=A0A937CNR3_9BURK|nr:TolC family protein [Ramlibacter monticola]MBL0389595.1 TolC family protein [Ramlibacter monticola]